MDARIELTIVMSAGALRYYPRKHLDSLTIKLLYECIQVNNPLLVLMSYKQISHVIDPNHTNVIHMNRKT
ncbi:hypothetical protein ZMTM_16420 [Methyloradius palustris]|uniref:Uncharacterized protein n=1 Tax=Methyloradius palustris TaxID=2778876 RepID=A0A8D5GDD1_9PROT|nr:hypothetical protein ZMTM_16420 [Methyloradius palustris]